MMNDKAKIKVLSLIIVILAVFTVWLTIDCFSVTDDRQKTDESYWRQVDLSRYLAEQVVIDGNSSFLHGWSGGNGVIVAEYEDPVGCYAFACDSDGYCWEGEYRGMDDGSGIQYIDGIPIDNPFMRR